MLDYLVCNILFIVRFKIMLLFQCVERGGKVDGDKYEDGSWLNNWFTETDVLTLQSSNILPLVSHIIQLVFDDKGITCFDELRSLTQYELSCLQCW